MKDSAHENLRHYILATAGHVDHGKSSLVRALTGIDPDRLPEEKARGITIDLGFAHLTIPPYKIGIVDVPGHEDFVRNMVSGVGSIDAALLVVAADDGWMPQTEEHLQILNYLGVKSGVVALTKVDLVENPSAAIAEIRDRLAGTTFVSASIVATSCVDGRGIEQLRQAIAAALSETPAQVDYGKPRLAIDRAFSLKGIGTIVTGTLIGGTILQGQDLVVYPKKLASRVRAIQSHGKEVKIARPGSRVALNLPDVRIGDDVDAVKRGDVVARNDVGDPARKLVVRLIRTQRNCETASLRNSAKLWFHHLSSAIAARVRLIGQDSLEASEECFAVISLESPALAFVGDRFVLRDWSGRATLAGGVVIDSDGHWSRSRCDEHCLRVRWENLNNPEVHVKTQLEQQRVVRADLLLVKSPFSREQIQAAVEACCRRGMLARCGDWILIADLMNRSREMLVSAIDAHHAAHPEQGALPVHALRKPLGPAFRRVRSAALAAIEKAIVDDLLRDGFVCTAGMIRRKDHRPALPPRLAQQGEHLRKILIDSHFDPPSRRELCPTDLAIQAMKFLIANAEAIELSHEVVISSKAYHEAIDAIRHHLQECRRATVADLKKIIPASRRVMVPLLERLDREGITRRDGDWRVLK